MIHKCLTWPALAAAAVFFYVVVGALILTVLEPGWQGLHEQHSTVSFYSGTSPVGWGFSVERGDASGLPRV